MTTPLVRSRVKLREVKVEGIAMLATVQQYKFKQPQ